jgi:hypothetical protein
MHLKVNEMERENTFTHFINVTHYTLLSKWVIELIGQHVIVMPCNKIAYLSGRRLFRPAAVKGKSAE